MPAALLALPPQPSTACYPENECQVPTGHHSAQGAGADQRAQTRRVRNHLVATRRMPNPKEEPTSLATDTIEGQDPPRGIVKEPRWIPTRRTVDCQPPSLTAPKNRQEKTSHNRTRLPPANGRSRYRRGSPMDPNERRPCNASKRVNRATRAREQPSEEENRETVRYDSHCKQRRTHPTDGDQLEGRRSGHRRSAQQPAPPGGHRHTSEVSKRRPPSARPARPRGA